MLRIQHIKLLSVLILIYTISLSTAKAQNNEEIKILFVGNSFTYYWNTPEMVEALGKAMGVNINARQSTIPGINLKQHWNSEWNSKTRELLEKEKYDYVVLQDHSLSTLEAAERFEEYTKKFIDLIRSKGAKPILFMTWAYDSNPLMQTQITKEYEKVAEKEKVGVVPAGIVWSKARTIRPSIKLFFDDKHPTVIAAYMNALMFVKFFTGNSILDLPETLTITNNGETLYLSHITREDGKFIRQLVNEFNFKTLK